MVLYKSEYLRYSLLYSKLSVTILRFLYKHGFTLLQLIFAVVGVTVLVVIVLANVSSPRAKERDSQRAVDLQQLVLALDVYFDERASYPGNPTGAPCHWEAEAGSAYDPNCLAELVDGGYIAALPQEPGGAAYGYYNYGPDSHGAVLRATMEVRKRKSQCVFSTGTWCSAAIKASYCVCLK